MEQKQEKQEENKNQTEQENVVLDSMEKVDLQAAFKKFKKERFEKMKHSKYLKNQKKIDRTTQEFKDQLRTKFVEQAKKYFGIPYHKRYLTPEDKLYNSPLFLDCCGLIRQIVYDLREDFGFTLGRWNQSYQYDILPIDLEFKDLKPGDLIFISATYYNEKLKPFPHRMTHVEIFTGGETGEQTIGARWQRGVVQYHDSYKFVSKTYHNMTFHFKSLDTWLQGICQSHCEEHPWRDDRDMWVPDKYSVFATGGDAEEDAEPVEGQEEEQKNNNNQPLDNELEISIKPVFIGKGNNDKIIREYFSNKIQDFKILDQSQAYSNKFYYKWVQCLQELDFFSFKEGKQIINHIPNIMQAIGNKSSLINTLYEFQKKYQNKDKENQNNQIKVPNLHASDFFPQSYQLDNMAEEIAFLNNETQGIWILKPKNLNMGRGIQIITDVQRFREEFVQSKKFYLGEFVANYMIDHKSKDNKDNAQEKVLEERYNKNNMVKNEQNNDEKQIKNNEQQQQSQEMQEKEMKYKNISASSIIQKYIENPLLPNNRKFDIRCYGLIATTKPNYLLLFHDGYLRFCLEDYHLNDIENIKTSKFAHLTNAAIQKKHPNFKAEKETSIWSMKKFENFLIEQNGRSQKDFDNLNKQIKQICSYVMEASMETLEKKTGQYELLGIDIIVDDNLKPYLLEVNTNPALFTDTTTQKEIIPQMMNSTIDIVMNLNEDIEKLTQKLQNTNDLPLGGWEVIYNQLTKEGILYN